MLNTIYSEDSGMEFGRWSDSTSKLMYFDSIVEILSKVDVSGRVADYGGANGILRELIPHIITIDIDASKQPDIHADILTHRGQYDLIIIRFVLHYLNDYQLLELFAHIKTYHLGRILVVQFTNEDLKCKYLNSTNEFKFFRTRHQLEQLLPEFAHIYSVEYECTREFYVNRLALHSAINHIEEINAYLI